MTNPDRFLLLAAHGSTHPHARQALEGFAARVGHAHPDLEVLLAFTAATRTGGHPGADAGHGLKDILAGLKSKARPDLPNLLVQSLHVIAGDEFERMRGELTDFAAMLGARITVSGPLLSGAGDAPGVARALVACMAEGEAAVLMGHGTSSQAQELYRILATALSDMAPLARLGVLEAADPEDPLSIRAIARDLAASGVRRARLLPFLTVAGRHAHKDLAGGKPESWKSVLARHGIEGLPDLAGLVEREIFARIWMDGIRSLVHKA